MFGIKFGNKKINKNVLDNKAELVPFFKNDDLDYLFHDEMFVRIYNSNPGRVRAFINELRKHYKPSDTIKMIKKYVVNTNKDTMIKVIDLYISCDEEDKNDFFAIVDKKYHITSSEEEQARHIEIDQRYNEVKTGRETYNGKQLDNLYKTLDYSEREYLSELLSIEGGFDSFKLVSDYIKYDNFKSIVKRFNKCQIDKIILNKNVLDNLSEDYFVLLVLSLLLNNNSQIAISVKLLIANHRYDLIKGMIDNNLLDDNIPYSSDKNINDVVLIDSIEKVLTRKDNIAA